MSHIAAYSTSPRRHVRYSRPDKMLIVGMFLSLLMLVCMVLIVIAQAGALSAIHAREAAMPSVFLCFDAKGQVEDGNEFAECGEVQYVPLKRWAK